MQRWFSTESCFIFSHPPWQHSSSPHKRDTHMCAQEACPRTLLAAILLWPETQRKGHEQKAGFHHMLEYHAAIRNQWDGYMDEHEWISKTQYWVEEPDACRYVISCAFKNMSPDVNAPFTYSNLRDKSMETQRPHSHQWEFREFKWLF